MNKKILSAIVIALVGLPMAAAASTMEESVVTGHTVYANMGGFDPDVALIAGLVENKVVWFNGVTVLSTLGAGFIYATEDRGEGNCDPREGENYEFHDYKLSFRDPNEIPHIVAHYTYTCPGTLTDPLLGSLTGENITYHVWITPTHTKANDPPVRPGFTNSGRSYNFATGVDTSFFTARDEGTVTHDGYGGATPSDVNEGDSYCPPEDDHVCNQGNVQGEDYHNGEAGDEHAHNAASVKLWFAKEDAGESAINATDGGAHPGTVAGCAWDTYCSTVTDMNLTTQQVWASQSA